MSASYVHFAIQVIYCLPTKNDPGINFKLPNSNWNILILPIQLNVSNNYSLNLNILSILDSYIMNALYFLWIRYNAIGKN